MTPQPVLLRTSERAVFKQCRQHWSWRFMDHLVVDVRKPALEFGTLVHDSLAAYYKPGKKRGPHPTKTFIQLYDARVEQSFRLRDENEEWVDAREMGIAVLDHYIETWGRDAQLEIVAPEMPFKVQLTDIGGKPFWYVGRFDAMCRWILTGEYGLLEHKTASSISTAHLQLDEQAGSYWLFAPWWIKELQRQGIVPRGNRLEMDMILYNFLRKAKPDARPVDEFGHRLNKDGSVSKNQPPTYFERVPVYRDEGDRKTMLRRIRQEAWEMRMVREGKLPIYKNPSSGYPDRHCEACPFRDMCELHETGSDWQSFRDQVYRVADPYTEYRHDLALEGGG